MLPSLSDRTAPDLAFIIHLILRTTSGTPEHTSQARGLTTCGVSLTSCRVLTYLHTHRSKAVVVALRCAGGDGRWDCFTWFLST